jgi:MFS family permease
VDVNLFQDLKNKAKNSFVSLNVLHIFNDGFEASLLLLLPFIAKDLHINLTQVGALGTLVNAFGVILALPAGYIATKIGGLKTLIIALFVYGLGFLFSGISANYLLLLFTFSIAGIGFGVFHPIAFALIAKWSAKETRGRAMGNFTAIGDVGRIGISAALTFIVVYIGWKVTSILYAIVAITAGVGFYFALLSQNTAIAVKEHKPAEMTMWQIVKNSRFIFATSSAIFDSFASSSLYVFLPFLLLKKGISPAFLGSFTAAFFAGNFLGKTFLGRFVDKIGNARVFIFSEFLMAAFIFFLANSSSVYLIIGCSIALGIFTKGTVPVLQTMISESAEHHGNYEKTFRVSAFTSSVATTIAPLLLGFISDKVGIVTAFNVMAVTAVIATIPAFGFHLSKGSVK